MKIKWRWKQNKAKISSAEIWKIISVKISLWKFRWWKSRRRRSGKLAQICKTLSAKTKAFWTSNLICNLFHLQFVSFAIRVKTNGFGLIFLLLFILGSLPRPQKHKKSREAMPMPKPWISIRDDFQMERIANESWVVPWGTNSRGPVVSTRLI